MMSYVLSAKTRLAGGAAALLLALGAATIVSTPAYAAGGSGAESADVPAAETNSNANVSVSDWSPLERIGGTDRYKTMGLAVYAGFPEKADIAIVASGENFPDALAASSLVGAYDCPLIATNGEALSPEARGQLCRLGVTKVFILGSSNAISDEVEAAIRDLNGGIETERLEGDTRVETAIAIADEVRSVNDSSDTCILAKSSNFPDALAISAWAAHTSSPIYYSENGGIDEETKQAILDEGFSKVVVLGSEDGDDGIKQEAVQELGLSAIRLAGPDRYYTAATVLGWTTGEYESSPDPENRLSYDGLVVATGENFPDALVSANITNRYHSALVLINGTLEDGDRTVTTEYVIPDWIVPQKESIEHAFVLGSDAAVSEDVFEWFDEALTRVVSSEEIEDTPTNPEDPDDPAAEPGDTDGSITTPDDPAADPSDPVDEEGSTSEPGSEEGVPDESDGEQGDAPSSGESAPDANAGASGSGEDADSVATPDDPVVEEGASTL